LIFGNDVISSVDCGYFLSGKVFRWHSFVTNSRSNLMMQNASKLNFFYQITSNNSVIRELGDHEIGDQCYDYELCFLRDPNNGFSPIFTDIGRGDNTSI
jgi:hypothetical protein